MKKIFKSLILFAAAATVFSACNKEVDIQETTKTGEFTTIRFSAKVNDVETKATLTTEDESTFKAAWENNDKMDLEVSGNGHSDSFEATWKGSYFEFDIPSDWAEEGTWAYGAYYPSKSNVPFGSNRQQKGSIYASQYDVMLNDYTEFKNSTCGYDSDGGHIVLPMTRATSILYFHLTSDLLDENIESATLTVKGGDIAADYLAYNTSDFTFAATESSQKYNTITITFAEGTAPSARDFCLWYNILPVTATGLTLTITTNSGKTATLTNTKGKTYAAGKLNKIVKGVTFKEKPQKVYTKVSAEPLDWSGTYLIVFEGATVNGTDVPAVAFNGALGDIDVINSGTAVTISSDEILGDEVIDAAVFEIKSITGGYSIQAIGNTGFIGQESNANGLKVSEEAIVNTISLDNEGNANIVSSGAYLRYNASSDQRRFRYYKSSSYTGQKTISLYLLEGTGVSDDRTDVSLAFNPAEPTDFNLGDDFIEPTLTVSPVSASSSVVYSVSTEPEGIATIDNDGVLTITAEGTITVTAAIPDGNATYKPASASYTFTVVDPTKVDYVTLNWSYPSGNESATSAGLTAIDGVIASGLGSDYAESHTPYQIKLDNTGDYIQIKTDSPIGEVSVKYKMIGGNTTSKLTFNESNDGKTWNTVEELNISGLQNSTGILTTSNIFASDSRFVKIVFTKGANVGIGGISITKADSTPRFTVESPVDASAAGGDFTVNISRKYFTDAITVSIPQDCDWITSNNVAENANSFSITVAANTGNARSATLTLSSSGVESQNLVVNQEGTEPGTEARPYTVAEALEVIDRLDEGVSTSTVWVTGTVSKIDSYSSQYHSITYWISADGTTANQLEVYSGKGLNDANFNDITDLAVGDVLVIKGTLKDFNGTPEFNYNSVITSIITQAPRYTVTYNNDGNGSITGPTSVGAHGHVTVTISPNTGYELDVLTVGGVDVTSDVSGGKYSFEMPANNVTVGSTFKTKTTTSITETLTVGTNGNTTWTNGEKTSSATVGDVTFTALGSGGNDGKYYSSDNSWRFYTKGTSGVKITVPSGKKITSVVITWKTGQPVTPSGFTASGTTSPTTYTANDGLEVNEVSFIRDEANFLAQVISVTFE